MGVEKVPTHRFALRIKWDHCRAWQREVLHGRWLLYGLVPPLPLPPPGLSFSLWKVRELHWLPSEPCPLLPQLLWAKASASNMGCEGMSSHLDPRSPWLLPGSSACACSGGASCSEPAFHGFFLSHKPGTPPFTSITNK